MAIGPTLKAARLKKQLSHSQVAEITRMKVQLVEDLEEDDFHRIAATIYGKGFIKLFAECVGLDPKPLLADYVRCVEGDKPSLIPDGSAPSGAQPPEPEPPSPAPEEPTPEEPELIETATEAAETEEEEPTDVQNADLFAYASSKRRRIVQEHPSQQLSHVKKAIVDKAGAAGTAVKHRSTDLVDACRRTTDTVANRLADIRWGDAPLKAVGVVIGILIVLLFVISGVSNCIGRHDADMADDVSLELAVDPPEPYFD